ncbi:MAG: hypothetical protein FJZ63_00130 [Chlamydiae bacterium]|nr:hypothetical protein [Chlamydiota bacterium]
MSTTSFQETSKSFAKILELHCLSGFKHVKKTLFSYVLFHALFVVFFFLQITISSLLYLFSKTPTVLAFSLFFFIFSAFTYLVLIFYFQTKKQDRLKLLKEWFLSICKQSVGEGLNVMDYHLYLAGALYSFSNMFHLKDLPVYFSSVPILSWQRLMRKCSYLWHWKDFQTMRKLLILDCIYQHLALLKYEPTNLEVHGSLANTYLTLASIYQMSYHQDTSRFSSDDLSAKTLKAFNHAVYKAIEEYKIILSSAPNDPWVLAQLAACYHELHLYAEEIYYFEKILEITSPNLDILYRLAYLYFQEGHSAEGFKLYKHIRDLDEAKADALFEYYLSKAQESF